MTKSEFLLSHAFMNRCIIRLIKKLFIFLKMDKTQWSVWGIGYKGNNESHNFIRFEWSPVFVTSSSPISKYRGLHVVYLSQVTFLNTFLCFDIGSPVLAKFAQIAIMRSTVFCSGAFFPKLGKLSDLNKYTRSSRRATPETSISLFNVSRQKPMSLRL